MYHVCNSCLYKYMYVDVAVVHTCLTSITDRSLNWWARH